MPSPTTPAVVHRLPTVNPPQAKAAAIILILIIRPIQALNPQAHPEVLIPRILPVRITVRLIQTPTQGQTPVRGQTPAQDLIPTPIPARGLIPVQTPAQDQTPAQV